MNKVSVICAFYNEEKYIKELLDSIFEQTYESIELICIDDGSTDNSAEIVKKYILPFEERGYELKYIYQANQGQAAATNNALKVITGKYLCWIDGDDYWYPDAIERKVVFLEENPEFGIVTSDFHMLYENENRQMERKADIYGRLNYQTNQFELAISGESIIENLAQMIRVDFLRKINPDMNISLCREGQNYQLLLPMLYYYKRGYVDVPLGCYRIHTDSHCHQERSIDEKLERFDALLEMLRETLHSIGLGEEEILHLVKRSTFYMEKGRFMENAGIKQMVRK